MERKLLGKNFSKIWVPHDVVLFLEIILWKMPFHSLLEIERKFKQDFLVEWKVPSFFAQTRLFTAQSTQLFCEARD